MLMLFTLQFLDKITPGEKLLKELESWAYEILYGIEEVTYNPEIWSMKNSFPEKSWVKYRERLHISVYGPR